MLMPVRRRLAALAVVVLVPTLGGCGIAGFGGSEYQTDQVYQPGVGVNDTSGAINVLNAAVVSSTDGEGTFVATFVNRDLEEAATLDEVTGDGVEVKISKPVDLPPDNLVNLAETGSISVTGTDIEPGKYVRLTLRFDSGQKTTVNVPVVPDDGEFDEVTPAAPSDSASPSEGASPSEAATPSASPSS